MKMPGNTHKWSLRETLQQYQRSHKDSRNYLTRINKVLIFGKVETNPKWHNAIGTEALFSFTMEVQRSEGENDHIPVIISNALIKRNNLPRPLKGTYLEIAGQLCTYDLIIDGAREPSLYVLSKAVSLRSHKEYIERNIGKNAVFLEGYVTESPIHQRTSDNRHITEFVMTVPSRYNTAYYIPCVMYDSYARLATKLKVGDLMSFYGHIQNMSHASQLNSGHLLKEYCTKHEVIVVDVNSSPMFSRANI